MDLSDADNYLIRLIDDLIKKCYTLCEPKACYSIFAHPKFETTHSGIEINNQVLLLSKIVRAGLKNSSQIALFIGTCGEKAEHYSRQLMNEGNTLESLVIDLIASELAESTADYIHKKIGKDVAEYNFKITNRYSPGYCNWPVSDQQKLFSLLGENTCEVLLTPSSLMIPIKSVSGIIGIGPEVKFHRYACAKCDNAHCIYRNKR